MRFQLEHFGKKSQTSPACETLCPIFLTFDNMTNRPNILVVCGRNKKRSRTAEHIFKNDNRFNIRSAGLSPKSDRKISENDLNWSDLVFVMETGQRAKIWELYRHLELPDIEILNIADDYEFMNEELIEMLSEKINDKLKIIYKL
jgi:protein-tyrosine phosphatase